MKQGTKQHNSMYYVIHPDSAVRNFKQCLEVFITLFAIWNLPNGVNPTHRFPSPHYFKKLFRHDIEAHTFYVCLQCYARKRRRIMVNCFRYQYQMCRFSPLLHGVRNMVCNMYDLKHTWWRHQMETFSALLAICVGNSPVTGEYPAQRPVTRSFDVFFDLRLHERLSKQSWGWWFETLSRPLWRHSNARVWFWS